MNPGRFITTLYVVLLSGLAVGAGVLLLDARTQYRQLKQIESTRRVELADAESRLREQERILERLRSDPEFVEKVIRKRLSYARPGEVIFRFEE